MPVDPEPVADGTVYVVASGRLRVLTADELVRARVAGVELYAAHFATCPGAQGHRGVPRAQASLLDPPAAGGLVWWWATCADPNRPRDGEHAGRIPHPLADRRRQPCRLVCESPTNGNRLVEFEDGFRTVAPRYATRLA